MDEEYVDRRPADLEAYRRLDAFAHVRLAPNAAAMARIRESLVIEATRRAIAGPIELDVAGHSALAAAAPRTWLIPRRRVSRSMSALLAATLTLGLVAGSVAASTAGGPLYGPRVWLEELTLPSSGSARADAQVDRLDARLADLREAVGRGDSNGAMAALTAYEAILANLETQVEADPSISGDVRDDVSRHLAVLAALVDRVPPQAQDALRHALDRSDTALDHIDRRGTGPGSGNGQGPGSGNGQGAGGKPATPGGGGQGNPGEPGVPGTNNGQPGPNQTADPTSNGEPAKTAKPSKPPKPTPTPTPATAAPTAEPTDPPTPEPTVKPTMTPPAVEPSRRPTRTSEPDATPRNAPERTPRGGGGPDRGS